MATIVRNTDGAGFFVRWSKQGSDKTDHNCDDDKSHVGHETNVNEKYNQDKEMAAVLGVAMPFLKKSNQSNQVITKPGQTRGVIKLPTKPCTPKLEEMGSCQLIENTFTKHMLFRTNMLRAFPPFYHNRQRTMKLPVQHVAPMSKTNPSESDDRECMAQALQCSIKSLVEGLLFSESELPDDLISEGCLTDEENSRIRKLPSRKDQIRILVCLIKGRDFHVMKKFIKYVSQQNPKLAESIQVKFENNKQNGVGTSVCTFCMLINHCDVKDIIDSLWEDQLIKDDLYSIICHSDAPVAAQRDLWMKLIQSLKDLSYRKKQLANDQLVKALRIKGVFTYLEDKVSISNLVCSCKFKSLHHRCSSTSSSDEESCYPDSSSDSTPLVDDHLSD